MPIAPFIAPDRDTDFKIGRAKGSGLTYAVLPGVYHIGATANATLTAGRDYYNPFFVESPVMIDQLLFECTTAVAATNMRIGLYPADVDWQPISAPLADSGDISTATTGIKTYTPSTPILLRRGRYLTVYNNSGAPGVRRYGGGISGFGPDAASFGTSSFPGPFIATRAYAAFPTPGSAWTAVTSSGAPGNYTVLARVLAP